MVQLQKLYWTTMCLLNFRLYVINIVHYILFYQMTNY